MSQTAEFLHRARTTYSDANAATLRWMLNRSKRGGFLDTKQNSITLADYTAADGVRGPDYLYGWIQGRGLEALATHAAYFEGENPALASALDEAGAALYKALDALQAEHGHAYFCYDADMIPVYPDATGAVHRQANPSAIFTYSDAFVAKGLVAAAARYAPSNLARHLAYFDAVIAAIDEGRFQMDERTPLGEEALAVQPADFGPRMILLGAAGMFTRLGLSVHTAFADRFISHVLDHHLDAGSGLLRNIPGEDACNVGHGIEFVGFALDYLARDADPALVAKLERVLIASFRAGFADRGISLAVSVKDGKPLSPYQPWWSLPETVRSAALCYVRTSNPETLKIWQQADAAFFSHYWRGVPPIAYQTMTGEGPVDFVPATPDLDPAYHTGLSLLAAIHAADALRVAPSVPTQA
jgi:hypothetical protein